MNLIELAHFKIFDLCDYIGLVLNNANQLCDDYLPPLFILLEFEAEKGNRTRSLGKPGPGL